MPPKKTPTTTSAETQTGAPDWLAPFRQMQQDSLAPLGWFGTAWLEAATEINRELAEFMSKRISEDVRTQHEIMNCKDPAKLQEIQARFVQCAIDDYTAETGTLVELSQAFMERLSRDVKN